MSISFSMDAVVATSGSLGTARIFMDKRLFDLVLCLLLLPMLAPLLLAIALMVKLMSPGPVFYLGARVGLNGKLFLIIKFRTMIVDAESVGFGPSTAHNDPRVTAIGRFLRRHKLDELPQLFNILKGEMSFVGPRPQVERFTRLYSSDEQIILTVRPGLTDYASIKFANLGELLGDDDIEAKYLREIEPEKNRLRIKYVREKSLLVDIKILLLTGLRLLHLSVPWKLVE